MHLDVFLALRSFSFFPLLDLHLGVLLSRQRKASLLRRWYDVSSGIRLRALERGPLSEHGWLLRSCVCVLGATLQIVRRPSHRSCHRRDHLLLVGRSSFRETPARSLLHAVLVHSVPCFALLVWVLEVTERHLLPSIVCVHVLQLESLVQLLQVLLNLQFLVDVQVVEEVARQLLVGDDRALAVDDVDLWVYIVHFRVGGHHTGEPPLQLVRSVDWHLGHLQIVLENV